ncbi:hypothetical protein AXFE_18150 [Acidithrix ferrooxidans]|uniref:Uncharacterized protein n=1 Tax=Acidithrix ferrooxidans TaxID=1280514 RepID=A0A0D8HHF3_9ACTN|nr:hypothetical protein AXFE_18150 [Acidithrix ferrooxidans]CAG4905828.1 unnamed protein product [Acidithrix sp. C25]CAG4917038.1 unnamed protein product [Acidithrix sp. C25]CAG4930244.1 unnamed protein product [Acidithrix sp. C25]CAG4933576.1 unnamed protein product [Acidithrix sp. C25]
MVLFGIDDMDESNPSRVRLEGRFAAMRRISNVEAFLPFSSISNSSRIISMGSHRCARAERAKS